MPIPSAEDHATLIDLRYASVDDRRGRAVHRCDIRRCAAWAASALAAVAGFAPLGGCARDAEPATFAVPRAAVADIRMVCPPGTFIGTMTINCPQPIPPAAPTR